MKNSEKRALQAVVFIASLVPLTAGGAGMLLGPEMIAAGIDVPPGLDSHFRYLSGLLFAIGLGYASTIPRIETHGRRFWMLTGIVMMGGLGRLISVISIGSVSRSMAAALAMELLVAPAVALWQRRIAKRG